jgi:ribosomal protein S8
MTDKDKDFIKTFMKNAEKREQMIHSMKTSKLIKIIIENFKNDGIVSEKY